MFSSYKKVGEVVAASEGNNGCRLDYDGMRLKCSSVCERWMSWSGELGWYVSMNGTHSDLSVVMVEALFGKNASFRVMVFALVISCGRKCRCDNVCEGMS